jgi:Fe-S oxidoreductase/nitrate reductase gamma subunit
MPIRETFWNIPHWAEIAQYVLGFVVILIFIYGTYQRIQIWRMGKPDRRTDNLAERFRSVVLHALAQIKITQDPYAGIMHLMIFWGMAVLFLGTVLATIDWEITRLFMNFQFLEDGIYVIYELALDIFGILLLFGLGMAAYRRYFLRPSQLENKLNKVLSWDDAYAISILGLIAITGFLVEGLRIAVIQPAWASWSPVGKFLAFIFNSLGDPTNRALHMTIWVTHALIAFTLIASIPYTKLFHLVTTPLNIFFRSLTPAGALAPARYGSGPGIKDRHDFTWKQILDFESCTRCGRCQDSCPSFGSGMSFSPKDMMTKLDTYVRDRSNGDGLYDGIVSPEELWACTTCRACAQVCPAFIDHLSTFVDMRRHLIDEGQVDNLLQDALSNLARYGNSFGQSERLRAKWALSPQNKIKDARKEPVEYLWFVGDYASYNTGVSPITSATAEIFQRLGIDFGILYESERNAGNDVRRVGEEGLFEMLVEKNAAAFSKCSFDAIMTTDPHSYNTLKNEYPSDVLDHHPIFHYTEIYDQLLSLGQLKFSKPLNYRVTYHDACFLGRYNEIYDQPRRVIEATGCTLEEMPRNRDRALCCGAGGGRIWMEEEGIRERPSESRIREAAGLDGVEAIIVACPKDVTMFKDAVKTCSLEDRLTVRDLSELVLEAL